jgi:hypothetical protein
MAFTSEIKYFFLCRYPYFNAVVGLALSYDPESYADGNVATGTVSQAGQIKGDDPGTKGYPSLPSWRLGIGLTTPPCKKP